MIRVSHLLAFCCIDYKLKYAQDDLVNQTDYVELGRDSAEGRQEKQKKFVSRFIHAENDKEKMVVWRSDLNGILYIFNVRSTISTQVSV